MNRTKPKQVVNVKEEARKMLRSSIHRVLSSSLLTSRASLAHKLGQSFHGKRDLYEALGYPQLNEITFDDYYGKYRRGDIAARIIDAPVDGAWQSMPEVIESVDNETIFEKEWSELEKKHHIYSTIIRLEKLIRIGQYGVLLFGFSDVKVKEDMAKPVTGKVELLYLQPYSEGNATIKSWDRNPGSERYGKPEVYQLSYTEPGSNAKITNDLLVHHSRVLHVTEGLLESNIFALPILERIYNRLLNLELIVGGSAEMFWQGAFPGFAFRAQADADLTATASELEDEIDLYVHDFKRYMKLQGIEVEKLSSDIADPSNHVNVQLLMISIATGIPKRILEGSERGELASSQDEGYWNDKLENRRIYFINPFILEPVINKLIENQVITAPGTDGYEIEWADLSAPSDKDKADVGKVRSDSIKNYATAPDTELLIPFDSFLEEILDLDSEKVKRIMDARQKQNETLIQDDGEGDDDLIGQEGGKLAVPATSGENEGEGTGE